MFMATSREADVIPTYYVLILSPTHSLTLKPMQPPIVQEEKGPVIQVDLNRLPTSSIAAGSAKFQSQIRDNPDRATYWI